MKKILFILLFFPLWCFSQTLPLAYDGVSGTIDGFTFPKNTLSYNISGASNIKIFVLGTGAVWGTRPYTDFTYNSGAFPTRDSLVSWINAHMFSDTSGGGDTATLTSVTTGVGHNITPNAIHVTGYGNIALDKTSTALFEQGANGGIYRIDSAVGNIVGAVEMSNTVVALTANGGASTLNVRPETGSDASVLVSGRLAADAGVNANDVAVMSQLDTSLQMITNGTGKNVTTSAVQITGEDNLNDTIGSITLAYNPAASDISFFTPGTYSGGVAFNTLNGQLQFNTTNNTGSTVYIPLVLHPDATGSGDIAGHFNGRLQVSDALDGSDVPTLSQVNSLISGSVSATSKSGSITINADGLVVIFTISNGFGSTGYEVSLTPTNANATVPCYVVNKQINTFQIQFLTAPASGSLTYDWIIHKN